MTSGGREAFGVITPQPVIQNMRLAFSGDGSAVYKPLTNNDTNINTNSPSYQPSAGDGGSLGINVNMSESTKKKRGRPRKYGPDGTMALALVSAPNAVSITHPAGDDGGDFASPTGAAVVATLSPTTTTVPSGGSVSPTTGVIKRGRGRPPGSTNKKHRLHSLGSAGFGFTPHVISVKAGEDVSSKIMSFSQHGPRAVCILSANGAISNVTLRQPATSGGTVTYQGRFEILSLSGSFLPSENGGQKSRTGGLSVSLSGQDGRVLGGGVAGLLMAASPVQVIVASFVSDGRKESKLPNHVEPVSGMNRFGPVGGPSSPPSRGTLSESSGSPLHHSANNSNLQGMSSIPWK